MTPHRLWTAVGVIGAVVGIVDLARRDRPMPPTNPVEEYPLDLESPRDKAVQWALSQEGLSDPAPYWLSVLGREKGPKEWCGAFALSALHHAGIARHIKWVIGKGFLEVNNVPKTDDPQPGDVAYFADKQHQALVVDVSPTHVRLANGNGAGGKVVVNERPRSEVTAFYSIQPWVDEMGANA